MRNINSSRIEINQIIYGFGRRAALVAVLLVFFGGAEKKEDETKQRKTEAVSDRHTGVFVCRKVVSNRHHDILVSGQRSPCMCFCVPQGDQ